MKKNPTLQKIRKRISPEIKRMIDLSFAISERMDNLMKQKGLSQRQLAVALGKSDSEISKWMQGNHNFTIKTIARLESVLGEPIIKMSGSSHLQKSKTR